METTGRKYALAVYVLQRIKAHDVEIICFTGKRLYIGLCGNVAVKTQSKLMKYNMDVLLLYFTLSKQKHIFML